ncbi:hypothetical protein GCM10009801_12390 [Streptomyces albiaxialis]|uniref:Uncharacterized protein n=1 Tax=Streptomyces albiaxialis TaxID=329523 RepID=A0ABN2VMD9_9ACTN
MRRLAAGKCPPFGPCKDFNPVEHGANDLLANIAWIVTAAAVAGVIVVGIQMALQVHRGEPGEGATHFRGLLVVLCSCIIGSTAGPLVNFLIVPYLT